MRVPIEMSVSTFTLGRYYAGSLKIVKAEFEYQLRFLISVSVIADRLQENKEIYSCFQLILSKDGNTAIELEEDEVAVFLRLLVPFAVDFDRSPYAQVASKREPNAFHKSTSMHITGSCDFPHEVCEMLNTLKFDCMIVA